jgi:hypothetical protein
MIDYWSLAKEFTQGDVVQKIDIIDGDLSPYVGTVTAVHKGLGVLDVQWPFGNERVFPDDVVRVNPKFIKYLPPQFDQSYVTVEIERARKEASSSSLWDKRFQPSTYVALAKNWHKGASEVIAYDDLYRSLYPNVDDDSLRLEVSKFYRFAKNAGEIRINSHIQKSAAYWVSQNRQYRATSQDIKSGRPSCPKCSNGMRRSTYRMQEGARHKVFACPKCLYIIDPVSILGPSGEPHQWFGVGA